MKVLLLPLVVEVAQPTHLLKDKDRAPAQVPPTRTASRSLRLRGASSSSPTRSAASSKQNSKEYFKNLKTLEEKVSNRPLLMERTQMEQARER